MIRAVLLELLDLLGAARHALAGPSCRFEPSCSAYAKDSLSRHPLPRAGVLILGRLLRCHPFHPGGRDPVPVR